MRVLEDIEKKEAEELFEIAKQIAKGSCCNKSHCGSIIVKHGEIIGQGYNSPPLDEKREICYRETISKKFKSDKTCCVHAEQRAIMDTLVKNPSKIKGSRLYFIRLKDGKMQYAEKPYCTICSKMALDSGVSEFVLWHKEGITVYNTKEYNELSFSYDGD